MLRKEQRQISNPFTLLDEPYQKLHLTVENLRISVMLFQFSATSRSYEY